MISWIFSNLSSVIPSVIALGVFILQFFTKKQLINEKVNNVIITQQVEGEKKRAEIAEHAIQIIAEQDDKTKEVVRDAVKKAKSNRSDFFN